MHKDVTEIIFLLDRSGSMSGLESDTIGGFNAFVEKQCQQKGETILTTVLFDDQYEVLWNGVNAKNIKLTDKDYYVRGTTALLDAVGKTILEVDNRVSKKSKEERPSNIIFVITTDGLENASREFTYKKVKELIKQKQHQNGWEFIFMGANIDVAEEADSLGIVQKNAFNYEASKSGIMEMYDMVSEAVMEKRKN